MYKRQAFVRWSEVGGKSWNFEGSTDYLFRVQKWTESIKPIIVKSIMRYEETEIDYFSFATAAEFYRLIFNGQCKSFQKPQNFNVEMLLKKKEADNSSNGHTKNWNDLLKKMNGSDGTDARNCVLQYYNLPQGTAVTSTNYEFDYISFNKAVKKVINTGLKYGIDDLQLEDPDVYKRQVVYSETLVTKPWLLYQIIHLSSRRILVFFVEMCIRDRYYFVYADKKDFSICTH